MKDNPTDNVTISEIRQGEIGIGLIMAFEIYHYVRINLSPDLSS